MSYNMTSRKTAEQWAAEKEALTCLVSRTYTVATWVRERGGRWGPWIQKGSELRLEAHRWWPWWKQTSRKQWSPAPCVPTEGLLAAGEKQQQGIVASTCWALEALATPKKRKGNCVGGGPINGRSCKEASLGLPTPTFEQLDVTDPSWDDNPWSSWGREAIGRLCCMIDLAGLGSVAWAAI